MISEEYKRLNKELHATSNFGTSGHKWAGTVAKLAQDIGSSDILDYGCGKCTLQKALGFPIKQYDPCVDGLDATPEPADIVVCGDVLEHIEPEHLDAVLTDLMRVTKRVGMFVVATRPAKKTLSNGRNAHLIQQSFGWWHKKIDTYFDINQFNGDENSFVVFVSPKTGWRAF